MLKNIHVIINPASGAPRPILPILNGVFKNAGVQWDVSILKGFEEAEECVKEALAQNVDAVAAYGGDGTVMSVASGLIGSSVPLMVLPGGRGNVFAAELGIPTDLAKACQLCCSGSYKLRTIDMGGVGERSFLLRISAGFEAELVRGADKIKSNVGRLAYALSGFEALLNTRPTTYLLDMDGRKIECEGLACIIANSGNLGLPGLTLSPKIYVDDGYLDVVVIRSADLKALFSMNPNMPFVANIVKEFFQHWKAQEVCLDFEKPQNIHCDGEMWAHRPISARVIPRALNVVVSQDDNFFLKMRHFVSEHWMKEK